MLWGLFLPKKKKLVKLEVSVSILLSKPLFFSCSSYLLRNIQHLVISFCLFEVCSVPCVYAINMTGE